MCLHIREGQRAAPDTLLPQPPLILETWSSSALGAPKFSWASKMQGSACLCLTPLALWTSVTMYQFYMVLGIQTAPWACAMNITTVMGQSNFLLLYAGR